MTMRDQMLEQAYTLLRQGQRPTADALVASLGGSKATAVQALQEFWANYLPPRLAADSAGADDTPPQAAVSLAAEVWRKALDYADQQLAAKLDAARAETESERAELEIEREAMADERDRLNNEAREARRESAAADEARNQAEAQRAHFAANNATLEARLEAADAAMATSAKEIERLTAALQALNEERAALIDRHNIAADDLRRATDARLDELRTAFLSSEARLMLDLDAARTDAKQARQEAIKVREGWEGRLEAERLRGERAVAAEREHQAVRLTEVREGLESQIVLLKQLVEQARADTARAAERASANP